MATALTLCDFFLKFSSPAQLSRLPNNSMRQFTSPNRNDTPAFELSPSFGGLGMQPAQMSDMSNVMPSQYTGHQRPPSGGMVSCRDLDIAIVFNVDLTHSFYHIVILHDLKSTG